MKFSANLCDDVWAPFATSVTTACISAVLCVITAPGNLLICWAIIKNPNRDLKSSFNYLVLNLAIADCFIGTVTEPVFVWYHSSEALHREVLELRVVVYMSYFVTSTASILSIAALATDRYLALTSTTIRKLSSTKAIAVSVVIWLFSVVLPLIYFAAGFYTLAFIYANTAIILTSFLLFFYFVRIIHILNAHEKQMRAVLGLGDKRRGLSVEKKATESFFRILLFFFICSFPSCIMIYVINLCDTCSCDLINWFRDLQYLLVLVNSSSNQFMYAWRMKSYRRAFGRIHPMLMGNQTSSVSDASSSVAADLNVCRIVPKANSDDGSKVKD
ncbi:adenosine receptor A2b-like [Montipora foliosa]|uniref:adenosine receptor A2b-like n=1 Tax=Montipora foliosa TaxID=591990 RepID=UPI0035F130F1